MPASVEKLYTTAGALLRYGPDGRLTTVRPVRRRCRTRPGRSTATSSCAAAATRRSTPPRPPRSPSSSPTPGCSASTGRVIGDESAFDAFRGVPASGFRLTSEVGPLSALSFNHGRTGKAAPYFQASPAKFAAQAFEKALERRGVKVTGTARAGLAPDRHDAAQRSGVAAGIGDRAPDEPALGQLHRRDADQGPRRAVRRRGLDERGRHGDRETLARFGITPSIIDGSGLSPQQPHHPARGRRSCSRHGRVRGGGVAFDESLAVIGRNGTV